MKSIAISLVFPGALCVALAGASERGTPPGDPTSTWYQKPFFIKAGDAPLDTAQVGGISHAAPYMIDLDRDGRRDLVVGSLAGRFYFYKNIGADSAPAFGKDAVELRSGDKAAELPNWCCMAVAPQFMDLDGDGEVDLSAGSYGGPTYWLKSLGGLNFSEKRQVLASNGMTLLAHPETFGWPKNDLSGSLAANIAWANWNEDDTPDIILGNNKGELFVWGGHVNDPNDNTQDFGTMGVPVFYRMKVHDGMNRPPNEILIDGGKVLPGTDRHSAPAVADWDGDGLFDVIVGSMSGNVFLLRNSGVLGAPMFNTREIIVEHGIGVQWIEPGAPLLSAPGTRSQVHVTDYDGDGKLDLLVGYHSQLWPMRKSMTMEQQRAAQAVRSEITAVYGQVGNDTAEVSSKFSGFDLPENQDAMKRMLELERQAGHYLEQRGEYEHQGKKHPITHKPSTGYVWVYLRN